MFISKVRPKIWCVIIGGDNFRELLRTGEYADGKVLEVWAQCCDQDYLFTCDNFPIKFIRCPCGNLVLLVQDAYDERYTIPYSKRPKCYNKTS